MARVHGIALLTFIFGGVGLWFWLERDQDVVPLSPAAGELGKAAVPDADPQAGNPNLRREVVDAHKPSDPKAAEAAKPKPVEVAPEKAPTPAAPPNCMLHVRDVTTAQDIGEFQWSLQAGLETRRGNGEKGAAALALQPDATFVLAIESDGYQPCTRSGVVVPAALTEPLAVDVFLVPAQRGTGVWLSVTDGERAPVGNVQVTMRRATGLGEPVPPPAWTRRAEAADGVYQLPQLEPGRYRLRLLGLTPEGELLPLLPASRELEVTGSNAVADAVALLPGCVLTLELVDGAGAFLDPKLLGGLRILLTPRGQQDGITVFWLAGTGKAKVESRDQLPIAAPTTVKEALPPGDYGLRIEVKGEVRVDTRVMLRGGERQVERVVIG